MRRTQISPEFFTPSKFCKFSHLSAALSGRCLPGKQEESWQLDGQALAVFQDTTGVYWGGVRT
jgi:hypothetical protein